MSLANAAKIFQAFLAYGPATCDEIESKTGMAHQIASARTSDLKRRKVLVPTGKVRMTRLGHPAQVLRVARVARRPKRGPVMVRVGRKGASTGITP